MLLVIELVIVSVKATHHISSRDQWPGVQRDLCQRYDCDEDTHYDGQRLGIPISFQNVRCDCFLDIVTKHENANDGQAAIKGVLTRAQGQQLYRSRQFVKPSLMLGEAKTRTENEKVILTP